MQQERDCSALFFVQVSGALPHAGWPQACVLSLGTQDFLPCSALLTLHGNWQDAPQEAASQQTRTQTHRQKEGAQVKLARQECSMQVPGGHWGSFLNCQEVFSKLLPWSPLDPVRGILEWHTCPKELKNSTEDLIQDPETHSLQHTWKKPGATAVVSEGSRTLSLLLRHGWVQWPHWGASNPYPYPLCEDLTFPNHSLLQQQVNFNVNHYLCGCGCADLEIPSLGWRQADSALLWELIIWFGLQLGVKSAWGFWTPEPLWELPPCPVTLNLSPAHQEMMDAYQIYCGNQVKPLCATTYNFAKPYVNCNIIKQKENIIIFNIVQKIF